MRRVRNNRKWALFSVLIVLWLPVSTLLAHRHSLTNNVYNAPSSNTVTPPVAQKNYFFSLIQNGDGFTEVVAARNATSRMFFGVVNGKQVARIQKFPVPIHFFDARTRQWLPIYTRIVRDNATGTYRNAAAGFDAHFASATATPWSNPAALLQVSRPAQPVLRLRLESARPPAPIVAGDMITYTAVAARTDLVYQVCSWGIKEDLVLRGRDAPATFTTLLDAPGTQLQPQPDGSWLIRDGTGAALWRIPAPRGADAKGVAAPVRLAIRSVASGYRLTLAVDPTWLAAPGRVFPVRIDPSLADPQYYTGETYVQSAFPDLAAWKQRNRFIGNSTVTAPAVKGITRIYTPVDLAFLPAGVSPAQISSAELVFTQYYSENSARFSTSVYPVQQAWDYQTLTWNNQPTVGNAIVSNVAVSPALGAKRWDVTGWVKQVLAKSVTNRGLMIRADDETRGGGVFWSSQCDTLCPAAERPYLQVQVILDSDLDPVLDTWGFPNHNGLPSFEQYAKDYGVPATTYLVTETHTLHVISNTTSLTLPISFATAGLTPTLPLMPTEGIIATGDISGSIRIPQPIAYLHQEVIVKALYDDQFTQYYNAALKGALHAGMAMTVADFHSLGGPRTELYGGTGTVRSIPDSEPAQAFIQQYHGRQVSSQLLRWLASQGHTDAVGLYNRLVARVGTPDWWTNPEIIGIVKGYNYDDIEIGHALLPYKVVPLSGGQVRVYVYDSNHLPSSASDSNNPYIAIDLNTNSWSYELAPASATHPAVTWVGRSIYTTPLNLFREKPILPIASDQDLLMVEGRHSVAYGEGRDGDLVLGGYSIAYVESDNDLTAGADRVSDAQMITVPGQGKYIYNVFGALVPANLDLLSPHNSFIFTDQENDKFIRLNHFHARTYDPTNSIWLTRELYCGTIVEIIMVLDGYAQNDLELIVRGGDSDFADPIFVLLRHLLRQILSLGTNPEPIVIISSGNCLSSVFAVTLLTERAVNLPNTPERYRTTSAPHTRRNLNYLLFGGRYHHVSAAREDSSDASMGSLRSIACTLHIAGYISASALAMLLVANTHMHRAYAPGGDIWLSIIQPNGPSSAWETI